VNVGSRSTPGYEALAAAAVQQLPNNSQVFAGQRDDPFFVELNVFDLLAAQPANPNPRDSLSGFNVHTIALEVPIASLTRNARGPAQRAIPTPSSASGRRRAVRR
jgi:Domain of unknown function (DUF4331)